MYALIANGQIAQYPYPLGQFRVDNPTVGLPMSPTPEQLAEVGMHAVVPVDKPTVVIGEIAEEGLPTFANGAWTQVWTVQKLPEEIAAANVRGFRNALLAECDWTQLADTTIDKQAWANYRQNLRDIPFQSGFPWAVNWPVKP